MLLNACFEANASIRNVGGLGFGLYLSKLFAEAHGGDLTVASVEDGGTSFTLSLPRQRFEETT